MGAQKRPSHCPINTTKDKKHIMIIGKATKTSHQWVYPFTILIILPAFIFAELSATSSIDDSKISKPSEAETSHQDIEISPLEAHEEPEYGDAEENDDYAIVENEDGERFLVVHSSEKRAAPMGFANMLRLDKRAPFQDNFLRLDKKKFSTLLRLDKKAAYNPSSFNSMLRLDKKYSPNSFNAFSNQLRLDKKSFKSSLRNFGLLRLD